MHLLEGYLAGQEKMHKGWNKSESPTQQLSTTQELSTQRPSEAEL